jgi:hypothetical protein
MLDFQLYIAMDLMDAAVDRMLALRSKDAPAHRMESAHAEVEKSTDLVRDLVNRDESEQRRHTSTDSAHQFPMLPTDP